MVESGSDQNKQAWELLPAQDDRNLITPRELPLACPLNGSEILIMGGQSQQGMHSDAFVFNIQTSAVHKIAQGSMNFYSGNNQCVNVAEDRVMALVQDDAFRPKFIEFTKSSKQITDMNAL